MFNLNLKQNVSFTSTKSFSLLLQHLRRNPTMIIPTMIKDYSAKED